MASARRVTVAVLLSISMVIPVVTAYVYQQGSHSFNQTILDIQQLPLYVDGYDESTKGWTRVGTSPYLDAIDYPSSYLTVKGGNKLIGDFDFSDSGMATETIVNATIQLYAMNSRNGDSIEVSLWNGSAWVSLGSREAPVSWGWMTWDATSRLDSWDMIDGARIYLRWDPGPGSYTVYVDCARIMVGFTS